MYYFVRRIIHTSNGVDKRESPVTQDRSKAIKLFDKNAGTLGKLFEQPGPIIAKLTLNQSEKLGGEAQWSVLSKIEKVKG